MNDTRPRFPLAYLITSRAFGTWLHGDERGSVDRYRNAAGSPYIPPSPGWLDFRMRTLKHPPVKLDAHRRRAVEAALRDTCAYRAWGLLAISVRTNHVHTVVAAHQTPDRVLNAFKTNAKRHMRETGCWSYEHSPWAQGGSRRYLWTERSVECAIKYVVDGQGEPLE